MNFQDKINRLQGLMSGEIPLSQNVVTLEMQKEQDLEKIWAFFAEKDSYYSERLFSFSFGKHVDSVRFPKPSYGNKERNYALGSAFEDMLTDNLNLRKYPNLETSDFQDIEKWCKYAKTSSLLCDFLENGEQQKEFRGNVFGVKSKGKIDFYQKAKGNLDLKSTSAKTEKEFLRACKDFGYYAQGAFYRLLSGENEHYIVGVSKKLPAVFEVKMTEENFAEGEAEIKRLIQNLDYYGISNLFKA